MSSQHVHANVPNHFLASCQVMAAGTIGIMGKQTQVATEFGSIGVDMLLAFTTQPAKLALSCQAELLTLASRRGHAALTLPTNLANSQSPIDAWGAQLEFCLDAYEDFTGCATGLMAAMSNRKQDDGAREDVPALSRDYITFSDGKPAEESLEKDSKTRRPTRPARKTWQQPSREEERSVA